MPENRKRLLRRLGWIGASIAAVIALVFYIHSRHYESTDDAFINTNIVPISPKVSGQVIALHVNDNQAVREGDLLVEIDPRTYRALRDEQRAKVAAAEAEARRAANDARRYEQIFKQDEISKQQLDNAQTAALSAKAALEKERAALEQDELNLQYTRIIAPQSGRVTNKSVEVGAYVQVGQTLFSLVPDTVWVTANFKETQLTYMRPGQSVSIHVDAFPSREFTGHVDSIQSGTGARFSIMPPENATGNFVKVVQRVPVKIIIDTPADPNVKLAPGMSVVPRVRVR